jgi:hypothetical protein
VSRDYENHGWRHARKPRGTDPTPIDGGAVEWAVAYGHLAVPSPGTQTYFDLSGFAAYGGNDESGLYYLGLGTGPLSAIHGLRINEVGAYRAYWQFEVAGTSGDKVRGNYAGEAGFSGLWALANTTSVDFDTVQFAGAALNIQFVKLIFIGGNVDSTPVPSGIFPSVEGVGGAVSDFTADVTLFIERLSDTYTGFPP